MIFFVCSPDIWRPDIYGIKYRYFGNLDRSLAKLVLKKMGGGSRCPAPSSGLTTVYRELTTHKKSNFHPL